MAILGRGPPGFGKYPGIIPGRQLPPPPPPPPPPVPHASAALTAANSPRAWIPLNTQTKAAGGGGPPDGTGGGTGSGSGTGQHSNSGHNPGSGQGAAGSNGSGGGVPPGGAPPPGGNPGGRTPAGGTPPSAVRRSRSPGQHAANTSRPTSSWETFRPMGSIGQIQESSTEAITLQLQELQSGHAAACRVMV